MITEDLNKALKYFCITVYLAGLLFVVFFTRHRQFIHIRKVNLVPISQRIDELMLIYWRHAGVYNFVSNLVGNILIFIPLPFALQVMRPRMSLRQLFFTAVAVSVSIEIVQFIFEIGVSDIDDVLLNSFGALLGILLIRFFRQQSVKPLTVEKFPNGMAFRK